MPVASLPPGVFAAHMQPLPGVVRTFYLALSASVVLYVYRFAVAGVNLSLFRVLLLGWVGLLIVDVVRGRVTFGHRYWPFVALAGLIAMIGLVDFMSLAGYPTLRRDIANHLVNVAFAGLLVVYVDTTAKIHGLLRAFALSSVLTTAVALYAGTMNVLPFEGLIRALGSEQARALVYVNDDAAFERATSTFFDPNFYGIYSMLVLAAIVYLWLYDRPTRWLAVLFAINLLCLTLTLSRTAVIGTIALLGITFVLSKRSRLFCTVAAAATILLLFASTAFQSYDTYERLRDQAGAFVADLHARVSNFGLSPAGGGAAGSRPPRRETSAEVGARVANSRSLEVRFAFIQRGRAVFLERPIWGGGSIALITAEMPLSTAHLTYLTLLARYGIVGALVYLAFLLTPVALVWLRPSPPSARLLVSVAILPLMVVYLSYDVLFFFEIQYLFFGVAYSTALNRPWVHDSLAAGAV